MSIVTERVEKVMDLFNRAVEMVPPRPFSPDNLKGFQTVLDEAYAETKREHGDNIPTEDEQAYQVATARVQGYKDALVAWDILKQQ